MARITKEQVTSINSKCSNGWVLDTFYFAGFGEKTLIKRVQIDNQHFFEFKLRYNSDNQIELHISKYFQETEDKLAGTSGLGKNIILEEIPLKRKSVNNLIAITEKMTEQKLLELEKETEETESDIIKRSKLT